MRKNYQKQVGNSNISYLSDLSKAAKSRNKVHFKSYAEYLRSVNVLLLNHNSETVCDAAFSVLHYDYDESVANDVEKMLLECPVSTVLKIKRLATDLCEYEAMINDVANLSIAECAEMFKNWLSKPFLILMFVLASSALFAQEIPVEWRKPFSEKVSDFWSHSNLCESTILVLFENQLRKDLGIDVDFYCGELIMIVNEDLILPEHWRKSILVVLNDERFVSDNVIKN